MCCDCDDGGTGTNKWLLTWKAYDCCYHDLSLRGCAEGKQRYEADTWANVEGLYACCCY